MYSVIKPFFIILLVSGVILSLIPSISKKIYYITLFSFIGYFYLSLFFFKVFTKKLSVNSVLAIIYTTLLLLHSFTIYSWFIWNTFGLPLVVAHCLSVISAYFYFKGKLPKSLLLFSLSSCFVIFMFFQGWSYWIHKINHGTFTGSVEAFKLQQQIEGIDQAGLKITNKTFENKIILLDFWNTGCGNCFLKFPQLQAFYEKYKNDDSIVIFALNKPIEEDKKKSAFQVIEEEGFNFPVLLPTDEELPEKFEVYFYPATIVIDRQGNKIYRGDIEGAIKMVEELKRRN